MTHVAKTKPHAEPAGEIQARLAGIDAALAEKRAAVEALQHRQATCTEDELWREGAEIQRLTDEIGGEIRDLGRQRVRALAGLPVETPVLPQAPKKAEPTAAAAPVVQRSLMPPDQRAKAFMAMAQSDGDEGTLKDAHQAAVDSVIEIRRIFTEKDDHPVAYTQGGHNAVNHLLADLLMTSAVQGIQFRKRIADLERQVADLQANDVDGEVHRLFYAGIYRADLQYRRGAVVTNDGCSWIALGDNFDIRPGTTDAWRMLVRRGKPGKDGENADSAALVRLVERKFEELRAELMAPISSKGAAR